MTDSFRVGVTLTGKAEKAFKRELKNNPLVPAAALARAAILEYLKARGHDVEDEIQWGGDRKKTADETEDNRAGVGAS